MQNLLKDILEKAKEEGAEVRVIHMGEESKGEHKPKDEFEDAKEDAKCIAKMNRILYEAHLEVGFTKNEALALTRTVIEIKN